MSGASIIFSPQFKDLVLEKVPVGRKNAATSDELLAHFPGKFRTDVHRAMRTLRIWRLVEEEKVPIYGVRGGAHFRLRWWRKA